MSDCKEWIKSRMAILKKQANFSFNQDLFISILLCLISGRDKHLILTAPPDRLSEVSQMAAQVKLLPHRDKKPVTNTDISID